MRRRRNVLTSLTGMVAALAVLFSSVAPGFAAENSTSGNGLRVSPVRNDVVINKGESKTLDVYITNITSQDSKFEVVLNDFTANSDESGNPALLLNDGESAPSHGLRQFVPELNDVTLKAGEQKNIKVPISIPANAAAGGYFGAVRFAASNDAQNGQNVALSASVASLILVRVPGDYKEQMNIESIDTRRKEKIHSIFTSNKDINVAIRFKNTGDVQEVPFGKITVTKMGGQEIYSAEVNNSEVPGNVLPGSIRKFSVPLKNIGSFGKYTVRGDFGYGQGQSVTATTNFYVIPMPVIILLVVLVVGLIAAIVEVPRLMKRYNRRVLRRAGRK